MTGTASQIEWADQIRPRVNAEFDRVAKAFHGVAVGQGARDSEDTLAIIAILEEKRAETMAREEAGYFIRDWRVNRAIRHAADTRMKSALSGDFSGARGAGENEEDQWIKGWRSGINAKHARTKPDQGII